VLGYYCAPDLIKLQNPRKETLILTRKQNESVIIDDDIRITVLSDKHDQVKPGIEAPEDVEIWREEIYEKFESD